MQCKKCGFQTDENVLYCPNCGYQMEFREASPEELQLEQNTPYSPNIQYEQGYDRGTNEETFLQDEGVKHIHGIRSFKGVIIAAMIVFIGIASVFLAQNMFRAETRNQNLSNQKFQKEEEEVKPSVDDSTEAQSEKSKDDEENTEKEDKTAYSDVFIMDRPVRTGFISEGDSVDSVPDGFIGIYNTDDLLNMSNDAHANYCLMADIDMTGVDWKSFGFGGNFQGNYHVIRNLNQCLFSKVEGIIDNLGLENVDVEDAAFAKEFRSGYLRNCYVTGNVKGEAGLVKKVSIKSKIEGSDRLTVYISNCYNTAAVTSENADATGGIVGEMSVESFHDLYDITIIRCENYGIITGKNAVGGIVGNIVKLASRLSGYAAAQGMYCSVDGCNNYGKISGEGDIGGIIGYVIVGNRTNTYNDKMGVYGCANYADIKADGEYHGRDTAGGIIGCANLQTLEGKNYYVELEIKNCLNTGNNERIEGRGGEICGAVAMENATCTVSHCIGIGSAGKIVREEVMTNYTSANRVYEEVYSKYNMSIAEMKNMTVNLPDFLYPGVWGIDSYYDGFPHPYSNDEREEVYLYYEELQQQAAIEFLKEHTEEQVTLYEHYAKMLERTVYTGCWPEDKERENIYEYLMSWYEGQVTFYQITDVNQDGIEELVIKALDDYLKIYQYVDEEVKLLYSAEMESEWEEKYGDVLSEEWTALNYSSFQNYRNAYVFMCIEKLKKDFPNDMGVLFIEQNGNSEKAFKAIEKLGYVTLNEDEEGTIRGQNNGKEIISSSPYGGGNITYTAKLDNLTLFGIYPGMDEKDALEIIKKYGFYMGEYNYVLGDYEIYYQVENGKLQQVSVYHGSEYVN